MGCGLVLLLGALALLLKRGNGPQVAAQPTPRSSAAPVAASPMPSPSPPGPAAAIAAETRPAASPSAVPKATPIAASSALPEQSGSAPMPAKIAVRSEPSPTVAAATPVPPSRPAFTPAPTASPDPLEALAIRMAADKTAGDLTDYKEVCMALLRNLTTAGEPATAAHRRMLESATQGLRDNPPTLELGEETQDYIARITVAAGNDILPAILILADNLSARNAPEAFNWYYYAASARQDPYAARMLAWSYWRGHDGAQPDKTAGVSWFQRAYDAGDAEAGTILGDCYLHGDGVAQDQQKGIDILLPLAGKKAPHAMTLIGQCAYYGLGDFGTLPQDARFTAAAGWFQKAIAAGDWVACGHLGVMYENGNCGPPDWRKAVELYLQGVANQDPVCMYYYACALEKHGAAIKRLHGRDDKAETYFRMAAEKKVTEAERWCADHHVSY
jgi:TPR repeat protein